MDSRLHVKHDLSPADLRNAGFFAQPENRAHLGSQLLVYDHVSIPTNDFAIVPALIQWLGLKNFEAALDSESISFLRRLGLLGYAGNGNGISSFVVEDGPARPFLWWQRALFGEIADAAELQLEQGAPSLTRRQRARLLDAVVARSQAVTYSNQYFQRNIVHESYLDLRDTPELARFVKELVTAAGHPVTPGIDLQRLPGVAPNALQLAGDGEVLNAADLAVRVAELNMEIVLAQFAGGTDLHVSLGAERILQHKLLRSGRPAAADEGFGRLLELNGVPDIRVAIASGDVSLPEIWKLRQKRVSKQFRKWLANVEAASPRALERQYVQSLGSPSLVQSLPARVIRFALTIALSVPSPVLGAAAGALDSLFVEKYLAGYRPKLMIDEIRKLIPPR